MSSLTNILPKSPPSSREKKFSQSHIVVHDGMVPENLQKEVFSFLSGPIWEYGWRSNVNKKTALGHWHAHFAGGGVDSRRSCFNEINEHPNATSIATLWKLLESTILPGHIPVRIYANGHTFGIEGFTHKDSTDEENYYSSIYYVNPIWRRDWNGETIFYDANNIDVLKAISPRAGRVVVFPGAIPHKALAPSRECADLRITLVFKSYVGDSLCVS